MAVSLAVSLAVLLEQLQGLESLLAPLVGALDTAWSHTSSHF